ncbi:MAG: hypothetical protein ACJA0K_003179 [Maricaulis maris]|jgi:hypothetical protein
MNWLFPSFSESLRRGYLGYKACTALSFIIFVILIVIGIQRSDASLVVLGVGNLVCISIWFWLAGERPRVGMVWASAFFALDALLVGFWFGFESWFWVLPAALSYNALINIVFFRGDFESEILS